MHSSPDMWPERLQPRLLERLLRPLNQPGLLSLEPVRRIFGWLELLERRRALSTEVLRRHVPEGALRAQSFPIVHALWADAAVSSVQEAGAGLRPDSAPRGGVPASTPAAPAVPLAVAKPLAAGASLGAPEAIHVLPAPSRHGSTGPGAVEAGAVPSARATAEPLPSTAGPGVVAAAPAGRALVPAARSDAPPAEVAPRVEALPLPERRRVSAVWLEPSLQLEPTASSLRSIEPTAGARSSAPVGVAPPSELSRARVRPLLHESASRAPRHELRPSASRPIVHAVAPEAQAPQVFSRPVVVPQPGLPTGAGVRAEPRGVLAHALPPAPVGAAPAVGGMSHAGRPGPVGPGMRGWEPPAPARGAEGAGEPWRGSGAPGRAAREQVEPASARAPVPELDVDSLVDKVQRSLLRQLTVERERRGRRP